MSMMVRADEKQDKRSKNDTSAFRFCPVFVRAHERTPTHLIRYVVIPYGLGMQQHTSHLLPSLPTPGQWESLLNRPSIEDQKSLVARARLAAIALGFLEWRPPTGERP